MLNSDYQAILILIVIIHLGYLVYIFQCNLSSAICYISRFLIYQHIQYHQNALLWQFFLIIHNHWNETHINNHINLMYLYINSVEFIDLPLYFLDHLVFVNSPLSTEKSLGRMVNFWIVLVFDGQINPFLLIVVIESWIALMSL